MNKNKNIKFKIAILALAPLLPSALATNITIPDGSTLPGIGQGLEDQETEPVAGFSQDWDLEAFVQNGLSLSIVGGFPLTTYNPGYAAFKLGDLFIDTDGDYVKPPLAHLAPVYPDGNLRNSDLRYEYVLDFSRDGAGVIDGFAVVKLTSGSRLKPNLFPHGWFPTLDDSNPWAYVDENGAPIQYVGGGTISYTTGLSDLAVKTLLGSDVNVTGGLHNVMTLNFTVGFNPLTVAEGLHLTLGCGNDNLLGEFGHQVPDGGSTVMLTGLGLASLGLLSRRQRKL